MDKCIHDKCYDDNMMLSMPPKQRWICRKCNEEGIDTIGEPFLDEYSMYKKGKTYLTQKEEK